MNGRVYDPTLGRFVQADPFIQFPNNSQSYNRYSYVLNNPMSFTDPTGYFSFSGFLKQSYKRTMMIDGRYTAHKFRGRNPALHSIGVTALNFIPYFGPLAAAHANFDHALVNTRSLRAAFTSGATSLAISGVFYGIGQAFDAPSGFWQTGGAAHIGAHALAGGVISDLQGGNFGHGFWSAGITKAANVNCLVGTQQGIEWDALRIAVAATIGGTVSKLTGGKFANGATTAAFAQAFNGNQYAKREDAIKQFQNLPVEEQKSIIVSLATELAGRAANIVDSSAMVNPELPDWLYRMVRGFYIHREFSKLIDSAEIPGFRGEGPSYRYGELKWWGFSSSSRPDATFGPIQAPYLAFELKTGWLGISQSQALNYKINLPSNTELVFIQPLQ
ncbi:RHS repeat domain-containing protein [Pseudoalteromonas sp. bablab_jr011]|uniref:RHS repeat domain-containing protein n=1 Tax=Pseudoalteromonas sp. bablab_jr011 TaxID=2755062 RepID=UPI0018F6F1FE|nr:RHS repeat-associated core domain-containing protein [Pseudoalteromonas sp. bablab_jr011]